MFFISTVNWLKGIRDVNLLLSAIETLKATMFGQDLFTVKSILKKKRALPHHAI